MANSLSTKTAGQLRLAKLETEINTEAFEAFYHIGQKLLVIKRERLYESEGFSNWGSYCASGRIDYKLSQADMRIRCSELRPKLPEIPGVTWSVSQVEQLCKCETDNDAKRVAREAVKHAKKTGERVTARLIADIRDIDSGQKVREVADASLTNHLDKLATILIRWRTSLELIEPDQWEGVDRETLTLVRTESANLTKFLRS